MRIERHLELDQVDGTCVVCWNSERYLAFYEYVGEGYYIRTDVEVEGQQVMIEIDGERMCGIVEKGRFYESR